jgi:FK506-binding protein 4/5
MADDAFDLPISGEGEEEVMGGLEEEEAIKDLDAGVDADEDYFPPTMKAGEEREIGKEGLKKKLVKEGQGWDRPETGDEVEGTYVFADLRTSLTLLPIVCSVAYRLLARRTELAGVRTE